MIKVERLDAPSKLTRRVTITVSATDARWMLSSLYYRAIERTNEAHTEALKAHWHAQHEALWDAYNRAVDIEEGNEPHALASPYLHHASKDFNADSLLQIARHCETIAQGCDQDAKGEVELIMLLEVARGLRKLSNLASA